MTARPVYGELPVTPRLRSAVLLECIYAGRKFGLSAWLRAVSVLIIEDLISSSGPGMRKRLLFNASCSVSKSMAPQFER